MTGNDIFKALGELDSRIVLSAAPEDDVSSKTSHSATFSMLGAIAAAIVILILAVPMLLDMLPRDELVVDNYNEVIDKCDLAVFGTYKGKTEKLTYSEYTFEVTEVLKGETEEKEITVRSEKKSIFSEDEMEKYAQSVNASFEEGEEYFLTLQGGVDEVINFISEQIIAVNDLASSSANFSEFLEENGITIEMTREELESFLRYIFAKTDNETDSGLQLAFNGYDYVITGYVGNEKHIEIPREYNGYKITVGERAFYKEKNIESIVFNGFVVIDNGAFYGCTSLKSVTLKEDCYVNSEAFSECTSLETLIIKGKDTIIGEKAFYGCVSLKTAMIDGVTRIGKSAFQKCRALESVVLSDDLIDIRESAFDGCSALKGTVYNDVEYIGSLKFPRKVAIGVVDYDIKSIAFSEDTRFILDKAFRNLSELEKVSFPSNLLKIGKSAFFACSGLEEVSFTGDVREIGEDAFAECIKLKKVKISNIEGWCWIDFGNAKANPLYYSGNLYLYGKLVTDLKLNVIYIARLAFTGATCLQTVDCSNVQYININAFAECKNLEKIYITSNIEFIDNAFASCDKLKVYFDGTKEQCKQENIDESLSIIICTDGILYR